MRNGELVCTIESSCQNTSFKTSCQPKTRLTKLTPPYLSSHLTALSSNACHSTNGGPSWSIYRRGPNGWSRADCSYTRFCLLWMNSVQLNKIDKLFRLFWNNWIRLIPVAKLLVAYVFGWSHMCSNFEFACEQPTRILQREFSHFLHNNKKSLIIASTMDDYCHYTATAYKTIEWHIGQWYQGQYHSRRRSAASHAVWMNRKLFIRMIGIAHAFGGKHRHEACFRSTPTRGTILITVFTYA